MKSQYNKSFSNYNRKKNSVNKNTRKYNNFKKLKCSPLYDNNTDSCYNPDMINELVYNWNKTNNDVIDTNLDSSNKYNQLYNKLQDKCSDERCWATTLIKTDVSRYLDVFAPFSPSSWENNPTEWLSNIEIIDILNQYEKYDKTFKFLGTSPIDFDKVIGNQCILPILCNFSLTKYMDKGINKIGIIFNTDPHDKPGAHWISLYINISQQLIFFFDSAGNKCPRQILQLIKRIKTQGKKLNISFKFEENYPMEHQKGSTECGMYCLFFIINMVKNTLPINYFKTKRIPDEEMIKYRNIYFNKAN